MVDLQQEITKLGCAINKATVITDQMLGELNQGQGEVRTTVLQNTTTVDFLLLKKHLGYPESSGQYGFNLSDYSQQINMQIKHL